jgi:hypothetical protein
MAKAADELVKVMAIVQDGKAGSFKGQLAIVRCVTATNSQIFAGLFTARGRSRGFPRLTAPPSVSAS